ncbi:SGNH/GDSL hydrolase family protein [[Mycoplasma] gypis]|uniref:SGNH/GDSL hydrolase family protein n=1 Tax=[Mycoplasma] gypis TaxID=92404 RepID=A0ABZ2RNR5_9BACT|nr:SGNH/GDSL hydrolase family protein [[Mycoplasma] gypis]MBN0919286.1 SGNH/GDSL hydrolase family protein [[Mycoplasma] gypis]
MDFRDFIELKDNNDKIPFTNLIENNLRYLAIGDSISAGFNSKFGFQSCGHFDKESKKVNGLSYPAYLARMVNDLKPNFLESFNNFSFSNITAKQYLELLLQPNYLSESLKNELNLMKSINSNQQNPFQKELSRYFKNFDYENGDFDIIDQRIKQANLITISLGANDFLAYIPLHLLYKYKKTKVLGKKAIVFSEIAENLKQASEKIETYLEQIAKIIRMKNSQTNIVFVGYPISLIHLKNEIDHLLSTKDVCDREMSMILLGYLNSSIKNVANKTNNIYVDSFDLDFWQTHKNFLCENILDIHPTEKGYKHIAQNILLKLALSDSFIYKAYYDNEEKILSFLPKFKYYKQDFRSYKQILKLSENDFSVILSILGLSRGDKLFLDDDFEKTVSDILKPNYRISEMIRSMEMQTNFNLSSLLTNFVERKFGNKHYEYKTHKNLIEFLKNQNWSQEIFLCLLENNYFDNLMYNIQNGVIMTQNISVHDLSKAKNESLKIQELIFPIIRNLFKANFILESKEQLQTINYEFLTEILTTPLLEQLVNHKLDPRFEKIRLYLSELDSFKEFADFLFNNLILNLKKYSEINTFDEAWVMWLKQNHYKIIYHFDKIIREVTLKENYEKTIDFIKQTFLLYKKVDFELSEQESKKLEKSINNLLWFIKENKVKLNKLLAALMEDAKTFSPYDYLFANERKRKKVLINNFFAKKLSYYGILKKIIFSVMSINLTIKKAIKNHKGDK